MSDPISASRCGRSSVRGGGSRGVRRLLRARGTGTRHAEPAHAGKAAIT
ncbi:hypothetical protein [Actinomadura sp. NBRC 104425]|nr:hypothetical protein [Actinomadura sp. NBRC 104425]